MSRSGPPRMAPPTYKDPRRYCACGTPLGTFQPIRCGACDVELATQHSAQIARAQAESAAALAQAPVRAHPPPPPRRKEPHCLCACGNKLGPHQSHLCRTCDVPVPRRLCACGNPLGTYQPTLCGACDMEPDRLSPKSSVPTPVSSSDPGQHSPPLKSVAAASHAAESQARSPKDLQTPVPTHSSVRAVVHEATTPLPHTVAERPLNVGVLKQTETLLEAERLKNAQLIGELLDAKNRTAAAETRASAAEAKASAAEAKALAVEAANAELTNALEASRAINAGLLAKPTDNTRLVGEPDSSTRSATSMAPASPTAATPPKRGHTPPSPLATGPRKSNMTAVSQPACRGSADRMDGIGSSLAGLWSWTDRRRKGSL